MLVEKLGGPSVKPYQPAGLWDEIAMGRPRYDQGKGDDLYRRSLYTFWKRTVPPPSMMTFDAADRSVCSVKRQSTSTPLQALVLLNDPQFVEAARFLGQRHVEGGRRRPRGAGGVGVPPRRPAARRPSEERRFWRSCSTSRRTLFEQDPDAAKKLLAVGEKPADATLRPLRELAAAAVRRRTCC